MPPTVAVIAPGMMGSAVARRLTSSGIQVLTSLTGRSAATTARAEAAGMTDATDLQLVQADFILSIVPPGEALALAERLAPAIRDLRTKPLYVDCNAVSPATVLTIAHVVHEAGARFVDGGIIGPPPDVDSSKTRIYVSGPDAEKVAVLQQYGLSTPVQPGPLGAEDVLCRHHQGVHRPRRRHDARRDPRRHRRCTGGGNDGQPARAPEMADNPDAENAQQSLSLGGRNGGNRRFRRR